MAIEIYDEDQVVFTELDRFRPFINGYVGGSHEELIFFRNDDATKWFSNVTVSLITSLYDGDGELGESGISFKFIYGERRPTEAEWDIAISGQPISLPDIGTVDAADTSTYHPVWVRTYVPGGTVAGINDSFTIRINYLPRLVGT